MVFVSRWSVMRGRNEAGPLAPAFAGAILGLIGMAESMGRAAMTGVSVQFAVVLGLLALATTLPLALLRPAGAAIAVTAATVVSLAFFHTLTVAGGGGQLIVLYQLGRSGSLPAVGLAMPFLVLALAGPRPTDSEAGILTVLLASLAPAAAWAGVSRRAPRRAGAHGRPPGRRGHAARAHGPWRTGAHRTRAARCRRPSHLQVAVQAETARLTTPGMPAAGAQRLSAIGDTARAALTEMRRLLGVLREDAQTDTAERRPQPGLNQLNDLLDQARDASGAATRLILSGPPVTLDPGVNALRQSGTEKPSVGQPGEIVGTGLPASRAESLDIVDGHGPVLLSRRAARATAASTTASWICSPGEPFTM
jgi:hypothetical protein